MLWHVLAHLKQKEKNAQERCLFTFNLRYVYLITVTSYLCYTILNFNLKIDKNEMCRLSKQAQIIKKKTNRKFFNMFELEQRQTMICTIVVTNFMSYKRPCMHFFDFLHGVNYYFSKDTNLLVRKRRKHRAFMQNKNFIYFTI